MGLEDALSGSSAKAFERDGVTYSHAMDPSSGRPVQGGQGVAVLADSGTASDAQDNAVFVMGMNATRALGRLPETAAVFFSRLPQRVEDAWAALATRPAAAYGWPHERETTE